MACPTTPNLQQPTDKFRSSTPPPLDVVDVPQQQRQPLSHPRLRPPPPPVPHARTSHHLPIPVTGGVVMGYWPSAVGTPTELPRRRFACGATPSDGYAAAGGSSRLTASSIA